MAYAGKLRTNATTAAVERALTGQTRPIGEWIFQGLLFVALVIALGFLVWLLSDVLVRSMPVWQERGVQSFISTNLSSDPAKAGIAQGLFGSVFLMLIVISLTIPVGVSAAIYLEEYAADNRLTRLLNTAVRNLAAVPAVVYGLLGLSVFVAAMQDINNGRNLLAGGLTLSLVVLPIVIITAAEALRSVPRAIREAGFGVGATKWEVVRSHVLPYAAPGIFTGIILTIARAFGETAPLLLVGAAAAGFGQAASATVVDKVLGPYTSLPTTIYSWARLPQAEFRALTAAAIVVLLAVVLFINAVAIILRNRYERRW
ncbi:MAG: phosphate ABC transporter permease PstA [Candidatus Limnocylindrales bacterium]